MYIVAPDTNQHAVGLLREDDRGEFDLHAILIGVQVVHHIASSHLDAGVYLSSPCGLGADKCTRNSLASFAFAAPFINTAQFSSSTCPSQAVTVFQEIDSTLVPGIGVGFLP
jgi:hypothetical protein